MKKWKNSIFLLLFLIGLGLILYPIVSSKVEDWSHSKAIADYRSQVAENAAQLEQKKEEARAYNGQLEEGDEVTLSNFREVLHYRVTDTEIIAPDEMQKVLIQPGRDLLTLVTCHPYPTTRQRYLVYCERVKEPAAK